MGPIEVPLPEIGERLGEGLNLWPLPSIAPHRVPLIISFPQIL